MAGLQVQVQVWRRRPAPGDAGVPGGARGWVRRCNGRQRPRRRTRPGQGRRTLRRRAGSWILRSGSPRHPSHETPLSGHPRRPAVTPPPLQHAGRKGGGGGESTLTASRTPDALCAPHPTPHPRPVQGQGPLGPPNSPAARPTPPATLPAAAAAAAALPPPKRGPWPKPSLAARPLLAVCVLLPPARPRWGCTSLGARWTAAQGKAWTACRWEVGGPPDHPPLEATRLPPCVCVGGAFGTGYGAQPVWWCCRLAGELVRTRSFRARCACTRGTARQCRMCVHAPLSAGARRHAAMRDCREVHCCWSRAGRGHNA